MSISEKLPAIGSFVFCFLALVLQVSAGTEKPNALGQKERLSNQSFITINESSVTEVNAGGTPTAAGRMTVCTGDWMGTPRYAFNNWFFGTEYYATYQDPTETGCPLGTTYPFHVDTIKWHVYNPTGAATSFTLQGIIWDVDRTNPTCPVPGPVICYTTLYTINLPAGVGGVLISIPMDSGCCLYGPYFVGVYVPDFLGQGVLGIVTDSAGFGGSFGASRTCANYNNYRGWHEDLVVAYGFPGNLRLWSVGSASDMNDCDHCDQIIHPGVDLWTTPPGSSYDSHFTANPIPADFFDPGSDPFDGIVYLQGQPLTTLPASQLGTTDAIVRRLNRATMLLDGPPETIPIEIVALNLVSINPITVTYNSGPPQQWSVGVTLSSNQPQQMGQMQIRKECCNGGTFTSTLPVTPKFIFTEVGSPLNVRVLDLGGMMPPIMFQTSNGHWSYDIPSPFDLMTCPGLVSLDHDLSPSSPDILIEPSSKFTPGFRTLPCDPDFPDVPYCGGKVLTLEQEMLAQHGVLPPQEVTPIEGACCLPDNSCVITDPACCAAEGGEYQGDFTVCTPTLCLPLPPVFDSMCSRAMITVTLSPSDPTCLNPEPPIGLSQFPTDRTIVRRAHGAPYAPGEIIEIELVQLSLTSVHPTFGPVVFTESSSLPSLGQLEVMAVDGLGNLTLGESFFDVFYQIDLPMIGRSMYNPNPTRMHATLTELPPNPITPFTKVPGPPDLLLDNPGGFPVGFLCDAVHEIISCDCCIGLRGDANNDGTELNVLDLTYAVDRIFRGGGPADCLKEGDFNGDSVSLNILDLTYAVDRIFRGGPPPVSCI